MIDQPNAETGCLLVGDYVDEAASPTEAIIQHGEVVRPRLAGDYVDEGNRNEGVTENLSRALLEVVQQETHAPSRASMVQSLVRLQAVEALREVLSQSSAQNESLHTHTVQAMAQLFASTDKHVSELLPYLQLREKDQ